MVTLVIYAMLFPHFQINVYVTDKSTLDEAEFAMLLAEFQSAQVTTAETSLTNLAILLMALFALLLILMVIITASVFLRLEHCPVFECSILIAIFNRHRSQRKEVYRCHDRTSRYEPRGSHLRKSPMAHRSASVIASDSRDEIAWPIETLETWNKEEETVNAASYGVIHENNSTVDSGRDSGSARFSTSENSGSEYKAVRYKIESISSGGSLEDLCSLTKPLFLGSKVTANVFDICRRGRLRS